jgi:hypothetical protein
MGEDLAYTPTQAPAMSSSSSIDLDDDFPVDQEPAKVSSSNLNSGSDDLDDLFKDL